MRLTLLPEGERRLSPSIDLTFVGVRCIGLIARWLWLCVVLIAPPPPVPRVPIVRPPSPAHSSVMWTARRRRRALLGPVLWVRGRSARCRRLQVPLLLGETSSQRYYGPVNGTVNETVNNTNKALATQSTSRVWEDLPVCFFCACSSPPPHEFRKRRIRLENQGIRAQKARDAHTFEHRCKTAKRTSPRFMGSDSFPTAWVCVCMPQRCSEGYASTLMACLLCNVSAQRALFYAPSPLPHLTAVNNVTEKYERSPPVVIRRCHVTVVRLRRVLLPLRDQLLPRLLSTRNGVSTRLPYVCR